MYLVAVILTLMVIEVRAQGYLMFPPARSTAWRYGYDVPTNYNDMMLNCGGVYRQWSSKNDGKCGVCGDPYDGERENEAGGKYATGTITGTFKKGEKMVVFVKLTAFLKGWFEFRLCPVNDKNTKATQDCFDQHLLPIIGNKTSRFDIVNLGIREGVYEIELQLPANVTCEQCVLQWKYNTGNSWGCDSPTDCGLGKGKQAQFFNCADIKIEENESVPTPNNKANQKSCAGNPNISCAAAQGAWENVEGIPEWCDDNCYAGFCPNYMCSCTC